MQLFAANGHFLHILIANGLFSKEEDGGRIQDNLEDKDMLENVGISSQKVINDTVTGQQCVVEAAIKETLSAIPGANGADIKVIVINKISEGNINL